MATRDSENARQSASCEVERAISPACPSKAMQPKVDLDFSCSVKVTDLKGTATVDTRATCTAPDARARAHHPAKAEGGAKLWLDTRSMYTALEAVAQHRPNAVVADKVLANHYARQADEVVGNSAYIAQVVAAVALVAAQAIAARAVAVVALVAAQAVAARAGAHGIAQHLSLEEAVAHYLEEVAITEKVSANTRQADEVAVDEVAANSAYVYTAQVVAAQSDVTVQGTFASTSMQPASVAAQAVAARAAAAQAGVQDTAVDGVFPQVVPLALQPEASSTHAELKTEANSVGDQFKNQFKNRSIDAVNTAKVDAQCESAKDVQSKEDEAKVEHVEAKAVATASLALVSTAEVLGTPEQHACRDHVETSQWIETMMEFKLRRNERYGLHIEGRSS